MPRRKSTTSKAVGADASGRYFKNLGYIKSSTGKYSQKKFYLGYDEDAAQLAALRLKSLWNCVSNLHDELKAQADSCVVGGRLEVDQQSLNHDASISFDADGQLTMQTVSYTHLTLPTILRV